MSSTRRKQRPFLGIGATIAIIIAMLLLSNSLGSSVKSVNEAPPQNQESVEFSGEPSQQIGSGLLTPGGGDISFPSVSLPPISSFPSIPGGGLPPINPPNPPNPNPPVGGGGGGLPSIPAIGGGNKNGNNGSNGGDRFGGLNIGKIKDVFGLNNTQKEDKGRYLPDFALPKPNLMFMKKWIPGFNVPSFNLDLLPETLVPRIQEIIVKYNQVIMLIFSMIGIAFYAVASKFFHLLERDISTGAYTRGEGLFVIEDDEAEVERKKEEMRRRLRALVQLSDRIAFIAETIRKEAKQGKYRDAIIEGYHELDEAFQDFSQLRRSPAETPLEHVTKHFKASEVNEDALFTIVDLFYEARFRERPITSKDVEKLLRAFDQLIIVDIAIT